VRKISTTDPYAWTSAISEDFNTLCAKSKVQDFSQEVENIQRIVTYAVKVKSAVLKIPAERLEPDNAAIDFWITKLAEFQEKNDRCYLWKTCLPAYFATIIPKASKWINGYI
jgi:hypothetical protein